MQKLPKNAKAILGAVTLALFSFAGAKAGALVLQQHLANASLQSSTLHGHPALSRLPVTAFKVGLVKNRHAANNLVAAGCIASFSHRLGFAGATSCSTRSNNGPVLRCCASPRAPPIS
jgi:hypothetical protein